MSFALERTTFHRFTSVFRPHDFVHIHGSICRDAFKTRVGFLVEKLTAVAQVLNDFQIAVDVCVKMSESSEQLPLRLKVARIELSHLGVKQVIEEE